MNVKELREALADLPDDLMVVVRGYERGVDEVTRLEEVAVVLNYNDLPGIYGRHEPIEDDWPETTPDQRTTVVEVVGADD